MFLVIVGVALATDSHDWATRLSRFKKGHDGVLGEPVWFWRAFGGLIAASGLMLIVQEVGGGGAEVFVPTPAERLAALAARIDASDAIVRSPLARQPWGGRELVLDDGNGNRIRLAD